MASASNTISKCDGEKSVACSIDDSSFGVSVDHFATVLALRCAGIFRDLVADGELKDENENILSTGKAGTIWHMVKHFVKPLTLQQKVSYVEYISSMYQMHHGFFGNEADSPKKHCGVAKFMLSYAWKYKVQDVADALMFWCKSSGLKPERTFVWICSLCINQHTVQPKEAAQSLAATFGRRVKNIPTILPLMIPWTNSDYVKRLWCLYEYSTAIKLKKQVKLVFTPGDAEVLSRIVSCGSSARSTIQGMLKQIESEKGDATEETDKAFILDYIETCGGSTTLDTVIRGHLSEELLNFSLDTEER